MANPLNAYTVDDLNEQLGLGFNWFYNGKFYSDCERREALEKIYNEIKPRCTFKDWIDNDDRFISVEDAVYVKEVYE